MGQNPILVQRVRMGKASSAEIVKGALHRIEWMDLAGEDAILNQRKELRWNWSIRWIDAKFFFAGEELGHGHSIDGKCSSLVGTQNGRGAEGFNRGGASGQNVCLRNPPCSHRHENGEHEG